MKGIVTRFIQAVLRDTDWIVTDGSKIVEYPVSVCRTAEAAVLQFKNELSLEKCLMN